MLAAGSGTGLAHYPHGRMTPTTKSRTLYISGTTSRRGDGTSAGVQGCPDGSLVLNIRHQMRAILGKIEAVIKQATDNKGGLENLIDVTIFLVDMRSHYDGMNEEWNAVFPSATEAPTRTAIGVRELRAPELIIEVKCVAVVEVEAP